MPRRTRQDMPLEMLVPGKGLAAIRAEDHRQWILTMVHGLDGNGKRYGARGLELMETRPSHARSGVGQMKRRNIVSRRDY